MNGEDGRRHATGSMRLGPGDGLAVTASQWLGRDPETGQARALRPVPGIAIDGLRESRPSRGSTASTALRRRRSLWRTTPPDATSSMPSDDLPRATAPLSSVSSLELAEISGFFALVPAVRCVELQDLAHRCVVEFDESAGRPRRRLDFGATGAAPASRRGRTSCCVHWGYPYVLEEMTVPSRSPRGCQTRRTVGDAGLLRQRFALHRPAVCRSTISVSSPPAPGRPVRRAGALQARRRTAGEARREQRGERPDESFGRVVERAVIDDRHRAGHVEICGRLRSAAVRPPRRRPRDRACSRRLLGPLGRARSISTGTVVLVVDAVHRSEMLAEPLTTTVRPASRAASISSPMPSSLPSACPMEGGTGHGSRRERELARAQRDMVSPPCRRAA